MEKIEWRQEYSIGVEKIDQQHQKLLKMVNILIENNNTQVNSEIISDTLSEMIQYSTYHFNSEEEYMKEIGYKDLPTHKAIHKNFLKQAVDFCMDAQVYKQSLPEDLLLYLRHWWVNHILVRDMQIKPKPVSVKQT